jgi:hypothetical protein
VVLLDLEIHRERLLIIARQAEDPRGVVENSDFSSAVAKRFVKNTGLRVTVEGFLVLACVSIINPFS